MKGLLQTIDLSNDEEVGIGQTCHFFHWIFFQLGARWSESQSQRCILMGYLYVLCDWFFFSFILLRDRIMPIYQMQKKACVYLEKRAFFSKQIN